MCFIYLATFHCYGRLCKNMSIAMQNMIESQKKSVSYPEA